MLRAAAAPISTRAGPPVPLAGARAANSLSVPRASSARSVEVSDGPDQRSMTVASASAAAAWHGSITGTPTAASTTAR